jgi:hypothetical protein
VLQVEPLHGPKQPIMLLVQPLDRHDILVRLHL